MTTYSGRLRSELLNARRLPARLLAEEVAILLGIRDHDVPTLVRAGVLKPLASGPRNCVKYFFARDVEAVVNDRKQMEKISRALIRGRSTAGAQQGGYPVNQVPSAATICGVAKVGLESA